MKIQNKKEATGQKWEYKSLYGYWSDKQKKWMVSNDGKDYPATSRDQIMNELGQSGWELVSALPYDETDSPGVFASTYTKY